MLSQKEDEVIADLGAAMKFKFMIHRQKGGWQHKALPLLMTELKREVAELEAAQGKEHIISECADIANYCAMIVDKVKGL